MVTIGAVPLTSRCLSNDLGVDLDGVVWLAGRAIPGAAEAISKLRAAGERVAFLGRNNSGAEGHLHVDALARAGIECQPDDLTTSAQAAASLLPPGSRPCRRRRRDSARPWTLAR